jgi:uncharacterized membrane protein
MEFLAELHPKIVHFPIALLLTYVLLEFIGTVFKKEFFQKAAHLLLLLGVIGSFFAVLTGNQAFAAHENWNDLSKQLFNDHQTFANLTVWYFTGMLVFRTYLVVKKKFSPSFKYLILTLALFGCFLVYQTAEFGGDLIKKYGVGTELNYNITEPND